MALSIWESRRFAKEHPNVSLPLCGESRRFDEKRWLYRRTTDSGKDVIVVATYV